MTNAAKPSILNPEDVAGVAVSFSAKELRSKLFANAKKAERRPFTFNGVQLEFLQPTVSDLYSGNKNRDDKAFIVQALIDNAVAPNTNDKVFEDTDYDSIMEMPMSGDMALVAKIVTELYGINVSDEVKN